MAPVDHMGGSSRILLRRLRQIMAGAGEPQQKLDKAVRIIAVNMVADVCSLYVMRPGEYLELFSTEGLKAEAVHQTRLQVGEGLVGLIADDPETLNLSDAWAHPKFAYKPETGEDEYHSLLGVPIQHSNMVVGVLVVQNKTHKDYSDEEAEVLETISMVLAEVLLSSKIVNLDDLGAAEADTILTHRLEGQKMAEGLGHGVAVLHEPQLEITRVIADDADEEREKLKTALETLGENLDEMLQQMQREGRGEHVEILETFRMFAADRGWLKRIDDAIASGVSAEAAVKRVQLETRRRMSAVKDPVLRERMADLEDLSNRLLRVLMDSPETAAAYELPENTILIARHLGPAELLDYNRDKLKGVVVTEGSSTAHVAIVARALGIPVVGGLETVLNLVNAGDQIVVDGDHGLVFLRPDLDVLSYIKGSLAARARLKAEFEAEREAPSVTLDGTEIDLFMNAGLIPDLSHLEDAPFKGVGLFRTELSYMVQPRLPDLKSQVQLYSEVYDAAGDRPVTFRTLDVGGDKKLPYLHTGFEENPALGWRAIRIGLDRPSMLRRQLAALLQAAGRNSAELHVMFPMISTVDELVRAKTILIKEIERLVNKGLPEPGLIRVGAMVEVPSLLFQLDSLLPEVDFLSVGTNDLMQFFFASDRGNPEVNTRYDILSPAALNALHGLSNKCRDAKVPLTICGEAAGQPIEALGLIGLGIRRLSFAAQSAGPIKAMIRSARLTDIESYMRVLLSSSAVSVRNQLHNFAQDHDIRI